jgi:hypothetical protein
MRDPSQCVYTFCLCCVQAVMLDSTDVNLWYKIGHVALRLIRLPLARHAFEEGLRCNPDHWPCLDNLITVLYTLSDYTSKLAFMLSVYAYVSLGTEEGHCRG